MRRLLFVFAALLVVASSAWATTPTFDAASSLGAASADTLTFTHTTSGTNRYLACGTATQDASVTVSSVTFNGVALSQLSVLDNIPDVARQSRVEYWYLVNPPATTASVVVSFSGVTAIAAGCVSYTNVHQTVPHGTPASMKGDSTAISVDVASAVGEVVLDATAIRVGTTTITAGAGQTERVEKQSAAGVGNTTIGMSSEDGASTTTMSWGVDDSPPGTPATAKVWATIGVSLKGIATVAGATLTVCASGCTYTDPQAAINAAAPGDTILLQRAATYVGEYVLRMKSCPANDVTCYITIKTGVESNGALSSASLFHSANIRAGCHGIYAESCGSDPLIANFTKFQPAVNNRPALRTVQPSETGNGCSAAPCLGNWWHLQYLEFIPRVPWAAGAIVMLGSHDGVSDVVAGDIQDQKSEIPSHYIFEQSIVRGDTVIGQHRGMLISARDVTIKDSSIYDIKSTFETQAVSIIDTDGPVTIINSYLEGSGETLFIGGADPFTRGSLTCAASPAPTTLGCRLSDVSNLYNHQWITVEIGGVEKDVELTSINTGTRDVTWTIDPETGAGLPSAPDQPGDVDWSLPFSGLTIQKSRITKQLSWRNPWVATVTGVGAVGSNTGGTLATGTYCYRVSPFLLINGAQYAYHAATTEQCGTVTAGTTGKVTVTWSALSPVTLYRVYGRISGGQNRYWDVTAPTVTLVDDGTGGTVEAIDGNTPWSGSIPLEGSTVPLVKNTLELKGCDGYVIACLIEGNVIERSWTNGQTGPILLLKSTNQEGNDDSVVNRLVTVRYNIIRSGNTAFEACSTDCETKAAGRMRDHNWNNNLIYDIGPNWGSTLRPFFLTAGGFPGHLGERGMLRVTIDHDTVLNAPDSYGPMFIDDAWDGSRSSKPTSLTVSNSLFRRGANGLRGSVGAGGFQAEGTTSWSGATASSTIRKNVWASVGETGGNCSSYPDTGTNFCPTEAAFQAYFVDYAGCVAGTNFAGCAQAVSSPGHLAGSDGLDLGANIAAITALTDIALSGDNSEPRAPARSRIRLRIRGNLF